jgi:hypothetical protein
MMAVNRREYGRVQAQNLFGFLCNYFILQLIISYEFTS